MKTLQSMVQKNIIWLSVIALAMVAVALLVLNNRTEPNNASSNNGNLEVIPLEVDHKVYGTAAELKEDSSTVLLGSVLDSGVTKVGPSPGVTGDGKEAPGIPRTEFSVQVKKSFKGDAEKGETIVVVLTGGTVENQRYVVEEMPWLSKGGSVLMYLSKGEDGKYYPMAGGAALASQKPGSSATFVLPEAVSSKSKLEVSEAEL